MTAGLGRILFNRNLEEIHFAHVLCSFGASRLSIFRLTCIRHNPTCLFRAIALDPPPDGDVIGAQASLGEQLLDVALRKGKAQVPPHCQKDDLRLKLPPLE